MKAAENPGKGIKFSLLIVIILLSHWFAAADEDIFVINSPDRNLYAEIKKMKNANCSK